MLLIPCMVYTIANLGVGVVGETNIHISTGQYGLLHAFCSNWCTPVQVMVRWRADRLNRGGDISGKLFSMVMLVAEFFLPDTYTYICWVGGMFGGVSLRNNQNEYQQHCNKWELGCRLQMSFSWLLMGMFKCSFYPKIKDLASIHDKCSGTFL